MALRGARSIAAYESQFYAGSPAVTVNDVGSGRCYYVAAMLEDAFWDDFACRVAAEAGEKPLDLPPGVEFVRRRSENGSLVFLLNHTSSEVSAACGLAGRSLLSGAKLTSPIALKPFGVEIIEE